MNPSSIEVTIELWNVFQAWNGEEAQHWAVCFEHHPLLYFVERDQAVMFAKRSGFIIVEDDAVEDHRVDLD